MVTVAVFRIIISVLLLINGTLLFREAQLWYGPNGVFGYQFFVEDIGRSRFSLLTLLPPNSRSVTLVFILHLFSVACLLVGLFTPLAATLTFITLTSIQHRNLLGLHGGDSVLRVMCFLLIFANAGQHYAIDVLIFHYDPEALHAPWGLRLMQLFLAIGYLKATLWKLKGELWRNGTALHFPPHLRIYNRFKLPEFLLTKPAIRVTTYVTLAIELMLGTLIWFDDFTVPVVALGILLHLGIEYVLNVQLFGWTMMASLLIFIPPEMMHRFIALFSL